MDIVYFQTIIIELCEIYYLPVWVAALLAENLKVPHCNVAKFDSNNTDVTHFATLFAKQNETTGL